MYLSGLIFLYRSMCVCVCVYTCVYLYTDQLFLKNKFLETKLLDQLFLNFGELFPLDFSWPYPPKFPEAKVT